jgi:hypothetical protein
VRRTTTETAKDQKTSSQAMLVRRGSTPMSAQHVCVQSKKLTGRRLRTAHATSNREETNFRCACLKRHSGCWPPPKNSVDGAGHQGGDVSFLHPLLWIGATTLRRLSLQKSVVYSCPPSLAMCGNPFPKKIRGRRALAL